MARRTSRNEISNATSALVFQRRAYLGFKIQIIDNNKQ